MARDTAALFAPGLSREWRSTRPVEWEIGTLGSGAIVTIQPREFESSVPWSRRWDGFFRVLNAIVPIFPPRDDPRYLFAALVHDWMLEEPREGGGYKYDRVRAAAEYFHAAQAGGAPMIGAKFAFLAVAFWAVFKPGAYSDAGGRYVAPR